jgi:hypothetical protein
MLDGGMPGGVGGEITTAAGMG